LEVGDQPALEHLELIGVHFGHDVTFSWGFGAEAKTTAAAHIKAHTRRHNLGVSGWAGERTEMSATRLLVLGVVRIFGTAHGYLVHNELSAWGANEWANIKWGSIYHALRQMSSKGLLESATAADHPWRVDYTITDAGNAEFFKLLRQALKTPESRPDSLAASLAFLTALPRDEVIALLKERIATLEESRDELTPLLGPECAKQWEAEGAGHVPELFGFWAHSTDTSIAWAKGLVSRLESGAYTMAGEADNAFGTQGIAKPSPRNTTGDCD
ncbi:MAG: PadR family transcriptional regulator, partial [Stackebrandtia sp.]